MNKRKHAEKGAFVYNVLPLALFTALVGGGNSKALTCIRQSEKAAYQKIESWQIYKR